MTQVSLDRAFRDATERLGCSPAALRAVFAVEASGRFLDGGGDPVSRFEPHCFPRSLWPSIGFAPRGTAPWRASLRLSRRRRQRMYDRAVEVAPEDARRATSWGAPQIMGHNAELAGHESASAMAAAFRDPAAQIRAFAAYCRRAGLDGHLRAHDWRAFAAAYNGPARADRYAARIESAYRDHSGGSPSSAVLRIGHTSRAVADLQDQLRARGHEIETDGVYGAATFAAVKDFQAAQNLPSDGIAGARTQAALRALGLGRIVSEDGDTTAEQRQIDSVLRYATPIVGSGGLAGVATGLSDRAQELLVGGALLGGAVCALLWVIRRR